MFCTKCGAKLAEDAAFCHKCGKPVNGEPEKAPISPQTQIDQKAENVANGGAMVGKLDNQPGSTTYVGGTHEHYASGEDADKARHLATLREAYLNRVVEDTSFLSLVGVDRKTAKETEARLSLGAVYTALLTTASIGALKPKEEGSFQLVLDESIPTHRISALEELDSRSRLVLLGDPGSGKSTFVNFVALCLAGEALGLKEANLKLLTAPLPAEKEDRQREKPQPWSHDKLLPLRVVLRDFAARGLPPVGKKASAKHLWDFIATGLDAATLGEFCGPLQQELLEQGGLLLLDGLDEVPEAHQRRVQIKQCVEDFTKTYPKCRILVTSRTYAYQNQDWRLDGYAEATLASFSPGQVRQFVDHWYAHMAAVRRMDEKDAQGKAELLKRAISSSDRLSGLAERPLLLTLMASLHAWRGGSLPEKREELYADAVDLLLDWWESQRVIRDAEGNYLLVQPSLLEFLKVDRQKMRDLLNELAFKAHETQPDLQGTADIAEGDLLSGLMRIRGNQNVNPAELVEYLSSRAGLLLPRGVGVYTFPHRTFQEYLAACYLTDHDYPEQLAKYVCKDFHRWREVALLAGAKAARGASSTIWDLADALCFRRVIGVDDKWQDFFDQWGPLLAGQALAETANLQTISERRKPQLETIRERLVHILSSGRLPVVERATAGDTLAALGDPRFDPDLWYLPSGPGEPLLGFVPIPAGPFLMGSDDQDRKASDDEKPQHPVTLPAYYLARYPVTVAQFRSFIEDRGIPPKKPDSLKDPHNHPVRYVTWYEACDYCRWLGEKLLAISAQRSVERGLSPEQRLFWQSLAEEKLVIGLPSEAEWEKAARGGDGRIFPWGDKFAPDKANAAETGLDTTSAVGCFPAGASPYGLLDMSGNVWEWTRSLWQKDAGGARFSYPYRPMDGRENMSVAKNVPRVLRGGAFSYEAAIARCACRDRNLPNSPWFRYGFRVGAFGALSGS